MSGETFDQYGGALDSAVFAEFGESFEDLSSQQPTVINAPANEVPVYEGVFAGVMQKAEQLDAQVNSLYAMVQDYENVYPAIQDNPALLAKWESQYNRLFTAQSIVNKAKDAVNAISQWWRDMNAATGGNAAGTLQGLGLAVAIPWSAIGIVSAAVASLAALLYSGSVTMREFRRYALQQENIRRAAEGLPPLVDPYPATDASILGDIGNLAKWGVIAYLLYVLTERMK